MYEKHFGLKSRPFRSGVDASGIFVGPAQVKIMASLKKALAAADAVVSVTGSVGVGKTTVVNRALEGVADKRVVARVGRMHLAADEVLELLLNEFDVSRQPTGTIQRFGAFKRLLHDWAAAGTRAFIVVEDAERNGTDALIELEALTAADSGDSAGASIILMGQPTLADLLAQPVLARLRQRMRLRQTVAPFSAAEIQGYLKHCIRAAGGEFDNIFDPRAVDMLYRCSEGVPRVVNNLCESVFAAAAEANAALVLPQLVQHVAHEEFGLEPVLPPSNRRSTDLPASIPAGKPPLATAVKPQRRAPQTQPASQQAGPAVPRAAAPKAPAKAPAARHAPATANSEFEPLPVSQFTPEPEFTRPRPGADKAAAGTAAAAVTLPPKTRAPQPAPAPDAKKVPESTATPVLADVAAELSAADIPELIQDTQPELAALSGQNDLPDLTNLYIPAPIVPPARSAPAGPPATGGSTGAAAVSPAAKSSNGRSLPTLDDIPTLSGALAVKPGKNGNGKQPGASKPAAERAAPVEQPAMNGTPASDTTADDEAKKETTITEIPVWDRDPTLAELRPDIEALEAAMAVVSDAPPKPAAKIVAKGAPAPTAAPKSKAGPFDLPEITLEKELKVKEIEAQDLLRKATQVDSHEPDLEAPVKRKHGFDLDRIADELGKARSLEDVDDKLAETLFGEEMAAASAEIAALVANDEATAPPVTESAAELPAVEITLQTHPDPVAAAPDSAPEPIEEQFGTSMTATLKALSAAQVQSMDESVNDEDEEKSPRRLFGLFRGST
jgi:type II secretory pathway predicted ATPase ExeA